ncbi:MAG: 50S ribosomal protein L37ae [Candidatus Korarchaeota archaeon]
MGKRTKKVGIAGTLRHLYGATLRKRWAVVTSKARAKYRCPKCQALAVKRVAAGIWSCSKCGNKYVAEAYSGEIK